MQDIFSLLLSLPHKATEVAGVGLINSSPKIACLGDSTEGGHCDLSLLVYFPFVKIDQRLHLFFLSSYFLFSDDFCFRPIVLAEAADHVGRRRR